LRNVGGGWDLLGWVGILAPLALLVAASAWVLSPERVVAEQAPEGVPKRRAAVLFGVHLASLVALILLTQRIFGGSLPEKGVENWILAWLCAGGLTVGSAFAAASGLGGRELLKRGISVGVLGGVTGVLAWGAGLLTVKLWPLMGATTLRGVEGVLSRFFEDVVSNPDASEIGTSRFVVNVDSTCSGYEGMGLVAVLSVALLWIERKRLPFPHALLILPFGVALSFVGNILRIAGLIAVGTLISEDVAFGGFHSKIGWVLFTAMSLALVVSVRWLIRPQKEPISADTRPGDADVATAYLLPLLVLIGVGLLTSAFAVNVDRLYGLRVLSAAVVLVVYRKSYELGRTISLTSVLVGLLLAPAWLALLAPFADRAAAFSSELETFGGVHGVVYRVVRVVGSCAIVPLVEEIAFRGYLMRRLGAARGLGDLRDASWLSVGVSGLVFGLLHDDILAGTLAGVGYGAVAKRTGRLSDAVIAHATTNATIAGYVLVTGDYRPWL
jgi:exosortase E/protease (VPEID-CTERM system)